MEEVGGGGAVGSSRRASVSVTWHTVPGLARGAHVGAGRSSGVPVRSLLFALRVSRTGWAGPWRLARASPPSPGVQRLYWQDRTPKAERLEYVCSTNKQKTEMTCTSFNEKGNVDVHAMVVQSARSIYNTVQINNRAKK